MDYDPLRIEQYQTQTISTILAIDAHTFTSDIYLNFQPDQIILKSIHTADASTIGDTLSILESTIVDGRTMCAISAAFRDVIYNIPFKNTRMLNGTHTFSLKNANGDAITHNRAIPISITMIYIKYRE